MPALPDQRVCGVGRYHPQRRWAPRAHGQEDRDGWILGGGRDRSAQGAAASGPRSRQGRSGSGATMTFTEEFLSESRLIIDAIDAAQVERLADGLAEVRERSGRLFILGVGGSAGHASHAVNDFRKLCGFEAYTPTDNVSELTARINDDGWATCFSDWLAGSRLHARDGLLVFSVGGGDRERGISANIVNALEAARSAGCFIGGVVGRDGGHTARVGDAVVVIPPLVEARVTAHTEGVCAVLWHLLVSHPRLQRAATKWESTVSPTARPV